MEKYQAKEVIKKILSRDYERWTRYIDEQVKDRSAFGCSFYVWKDKNGMIEDDATVLADILSD